MVCTRRNVASSAINVQGAALEVVETAHVIEADNVIGVGVRQ